MKKRLFSVGCEAWFARTLTAVLLAAALLPTVHGAERMVLAEHFSNIG